MTVELITVSFLGFDERSKYSYQLFLKSFKQVKHELIDDYRNAQLCLVDKDAYQIQQQYESLIKNHPDKYILTFSVTDNPDTGDREFFLKKPVKQELLRKALTEIRHLISDENTIEAHAAEPDKSVTLQNSDSNIIEVVAEIPKKIINNPSIKKDGLSTISTKNTHNKTPALIMKSQKKPTTNAGKLLNVQHGDYHVGGQHEKYYIGQQDDINLNDKKQLPTIFYEPKKLLQMIVKRAIIGSQTKQKIVQLNILNHIFYFDDQEKKVYSADRLTAIRPLCAIENMEQISYQIKDDLFREKLYKCFQTNEDAESNEKFVTQSWTREYYIWLITLWCSRGRLPKETDLTRPVYLKQWPNLTRLEQIPHATRIAALIHDQPRTLFDIAKQLGIKQRYVFAFFSACKSIDLLDVSMRDVDSLFASEKPKTNKNKSILSKLLGKLTNFSASTATNNLATGAEK